MCVFVWVWHWTGHSSSHRSTSNFGENSQAPGIHTHCGLLYSTWRSKRCFCTPCFSDFQILRVDFCLQVTVRVVHDTQTLWKLCKDTFLFDKVSKPLLGFLLLLLWVGHNGHGGNAIAVLHPPNTTVVRYLEDTWAVVESCLKLWEILPKHPKTAQIAKGVAYDIFLANLAQIIN